MHLPVASICEFPSLIICTYCSLKIPHDKFAFFFHHLQNKCQLQGSLNTLTYIQKAQIVEERNHSESEGRSTSQKRLALWAKIKFCLNAPPRKPVMFRMLSASSSLEVEKRNGKEKQKRQNSRDGSEVGSMGSGSARS